MPFTFDLTWLKDAIPLLVNGFGISTVAFGLWKLFTFCVAKCDEWTFKNGELSQRSIEIERVRANGLEGQVGRLEAQRLNLEQRLEAAEAREQRALDENALLSTRLEEHSARATLELQRAAQREQALLRALELNAAGRDPWLPCSVEDRGERTSDDEPSAPRWRPPH